MIDYSIMQDIARGVVESSAACDGQLFTGKVTSASPLKIKLSNEAGGIELDGDDIILTSAVVSKKLYIKKHKHEEDERLTDMTAKVTTGAGAGGDVGFILAGTPSDPPPTPGTTLSLQHKHTIHTSTLDAWVTEYGNRLPRNPEDYDESGEQVCITINRSLEEGDSVIMTRVSHGQQFIVLSRYFEVDKPGEDDE